MKRWPASMTARSPSNGRTMRDLSYLVAFMGLVFLLGAGFSWWKVVREPEREPTIGRIGIDSRRVKSATMVTLAAFALSSIAAVVAAIGWFVR